MIIFESLRDFSSDLPLAKNEMCRIYPISKPNCNIENVEDLPMSPDYSAWCISFTYTYNNTINFQFCRYSNEFIF